MTDYIAMIDSYDFVHGLGLEILEGNEENHIKWEAQNWGWIEMPAKPEAQITEEK